jgi:hypothetical protein
VGQGVEWEVLKRVQINPQPNHDREKGTGYGVGYYTYAQRFGGLYDPEKVNAHRLDSNGKAKNRPTVHTQLIEKQQTQG